MAVSVALCDDDPITRTVLSLDLSAAGFHVQAALSGVEEAMRFLTASTPDILLLDLNMAAGGGLELLGYLKVKDLLAGTMVVMITSEESDYFIDRAKKLGARGCLTKPIDAHRLVDTINRALAGNSLHWIDDQAMLRPIGSDVLQRSDGWRDNVGAPSAAVGYSGRKQRCILSVEDTVCNQQILALFLSETSYIVDQVQNGFDALAAIRAKRYDLVLMDLNLPDIDGLEVVRRIRRAERPEARLPIIAVTADVLAYQVADAKAAGVDAHVAKPFTSAVLREAIERQFNIPAVTLENINPTVAELTRSYGKPAVTRLLHALVSQMGGLHAAPPKRAELQHAAHALKGAASSLGFTAVSNACSELETACKNGEIVDPLVSKAAIACASTRKQIIGCLALAA